jgi:tRNA (adenine22-N1)-methyltransferase
MTLSPRLAAAAELFPVCRLGADVGCDHGKLSLYLLQTGKAERLIVSDVSAPSLKKAETLLKGFGARAAFVVSDGFSKFSEEPACAAIAGMGGGEITEILRAAPFTVKTLVCQPMKNAYALRGFLYKSGYGIDREAVAREGNRFYTLFRAVYGYPAPAELTEETLYFGDARARTQNDAFLRYAEAERRKAQSLLKRNLDAASRKTLEKYLDIIESL